MLGLFGTLDLGARSLSAQQLGTEVVGQNLANVNNPAYARQRVVLQSSTPLNTTIGQEGTGVTAVSIQQVRDALLDSQVTAEGSVTGSLNAQQQALQDAQTALQEQITNTSTSGSSSSPNGLTQSLSNLFNSFQSLTTNPTSISQRQSVIANAQQVATQFNQVSSQLSGIASNLNTSIQNDVDGANQDLSDIASLNKQIILAESGGGTANDLTDLRQQKIEDLAGKVQITTTTDANGGVDVSIGGVTMVSGAKSLDSLQTYDAGGGQILVRAQTAGTPLTLTGGSIEGNITVRDGALADLQTSMNTLAGQLVSQVNGIYSSGYDLNGNTGQPFFTGTDAASIAVNSALAADPSTLQASGTAGAAGDNSVALALAQLANGKISGLNNQTFTQSFAQTVSGLGETLASVNDQVANSGAVATMLTNQRQSVSGVSLDEEMTQLMQYQQAYRASAELITTINEMLQTVNSMKTA